jgi:hypothetical protein
MTFKQKMNNTEEITSEYPQSQTPKEHPQSQTPKVDGHIGHNQH